MYCYGRKIPLCILMKIYLFNENKFFHKNIFVMKKYIFNENKSFYENISFFVAIAGKLLCVF